MGSPLLVRKKLDRGSAYIVAFMIAAMSFVALASGLGLVALLIMTIAAALLRSGPWSLYENLLLHWVLKIKTRETPMTANPQATKEGTLVTKEDWIYSSYSFQHSNMYGDPRVCESIRQWLCRSERFCFLGTPGLTERDRIFESLDHSRIEVGAVNSSSCLKSIQSPIVRCEKPWPAMVPQYILDSDAYRAHFRHQDQEPG